MDSWEEQHSQPPEPPCTRGCLPGACWCAEMDEAERLMGAAEAAYDRLNDR